MKKYFRALIVDDERLSRKELKSMLAEYDNVEIIGEAEDVPSAEQAAGELKPDVIFLDIQMPGQTGFDLLDKIDNKIKIIFVTAYDEYAIKAFEVNAMDYLLKPINPERLRASIERLELENDNTIIEENLRVLSYDDRLFLMLNNHMKFLKLDSLISINAAGDYTELLLKGGQKGLTLKSMKEWETRLPEQYFCRIHRSTILNMEYVEKVEEWFNHSFRVYCTGIEEPFVMSRRYAVKLKEKLG